MTVPPVALTVMKESIDALERIRGEAIAHGSATVDVKTADDLLNNCRMAFLAFEALKEAEGEKP